MGYVLEFLKDDKVIRTFFNKDNYELANEMFNKFGHKIKNGTEIEHLITELPINCELIKEFKFDNNVYSSTCIDIEALKYPFIDVGRTTESTLELTEQNK